MNDNYKDSDPTRLFGLAKDYEAGVLRIDAGSQGEAQIFYTRTFYRGQFQPLPTSSLASFTVLSRRLLEAFTVEQRQPVDLYGATPPDPDTPDIRGGFTSGVLNIDDERYAAIHMMNNHGTERWIVHLAHNSIASLDRYIERRQELSKALVQYPQTRDTMAQDILWEALDRIPNLDKFDIALFVQSLGLPSATDNA